MEKGHHRKQFLIFSPQRELTVCYTPSPYSKMADILVFFCFHANWPLWPRSMLSILLNFTFESEAIMPICMETKDYLNGNLVPRSHSVTGNVRSGKVRQYTLFHWLLKKRLRQCNLRSDLLISWGTSVKVK